MASRQYLILQDPIAKEDLPSLLGRIVLDYNRPFDHSAPKDPSKVANRHLKGVVSRKGNRILGKTSIRSRISATIERLASVSFSYDELLEVDFESSRIETHGIRDHSDVLAELYKQSGEEIEELLDKDAWWLKLGPDTCYMVVGYKTISDAVVKLTVKSGSNIAGQAKVPIGAVAAAVAAPISQNATIGGEVEKARENELKISSEIIGTVGIAVEYRRYLRSKLRAIFTGSKKPLPGDLVEREVLTFKAGETMGGADSLLFEYSEDEDDFEPEGGDEGAYDVCTVGLETFYLPKS